MEFEYIEGHHYGEILGKKIYDVLKEYDICQKLFCITADGASNNGTMCEEIERLLSEDGISWSAEKNRIHCMNHVINLAVQDFLKSIKAIRTNTDGSDFVEEDMEPGEPLPEGFALALYKIRTITKVIVYPLVSDCLLIFRKLHQALFTLNVSVNVVNSRSFQH